MIGSRHDTLPAHSSSLFGVSDTAATPSRGIRRFPALAATDAAWYATAFGEVYSVIYAHRTVEAASGEADFAARQLGLARDDCVLDLCCGNGRHMVHLCKHAGAVAGLDYSAHLLGLARENVGAGARLVRGDMRALPFGANFDVVVNFFTSFGYFSDDAENRGVAFEMARVLKPGGRFFIDYLNPSHVVASLVPRSRREHAGYEIEEERWIDEAAQRVNKRTVVRKADAPSTPDALVARTEESVRLYSFEEMRAMLDAAGLEIVSAFGDYQGNALTEDAPRLLLIGRRRTAHA